MAVIIKEIYFKISFLVYSFIETYKDVKNEKSNCDYNDHDSLYLTKITRSIINRL